MNVPEDILHAREVARHLKLDEDEFREKIFDIREAEQIIKKVALILKDVAESPRINKVVNLGVASVEVGCISIAKEKHFFSGLGSEEIFAGYERHKNNPNNEECFQGLLNMYERDLLRDSAVSSALEFKFLTPFLDRELVKYSLAIPIQHKINSSGSKMILRKAAELYLGKYSLRPKKAAQYGSSFDKAIGRLAKGKTKMEYLRSLA